MSNIKIRPYEEADFQSVTALWHESKRRAFPYVEAMQRYTLEGDRSYFQTGVLNNNDVWIAQQNGRIVGFMAYKDGFIDLLFMSVDSQRQGVGTALLEKAKELSPNQLRAFTFQKNIPSRTFFEKHGFTIIGAGLSPSPEFEPDLEYYWSPQGVNPRMKPNTIRVIAIGLFLHQERILVFEGWDPGKKETFYRPLGGQVEFGERASAAIRREIREEIDAEIINLKFIKILQNMFEFNGQSGHEVVFVYQGDFSDSLLYEKESFIGVEDDGTEFKAIWKPIADFADPTRPLYPDGFPELLSEILAKDQ